MRYRTISAVWTVVAVLAAVTLSTLGLSAVVGSGDPPDRRVLAPVTEPAHPVAAEIQDLKTAQAARLRELTARALATEDPDEELALQRDIQRVKLDTEIGIYQAQLRHAESRGDLKTAATLREVLTAYEKLGQRRAGEDLDLPPRDAEGEEVSP